jgi:hypothetical protein
VGFGYLHSTTRYRQPSGEAYQEHIWLPTQHYYISAAFRLSLSRTHLAMQRMPNKMNGALLAIVRPYAREPARLLWPMVPLLDPYNSSPWPRNITTTSLTLKTYLYLSDDITNCSSLSLSLYMLKPFPCTASHRAMKMNGRVHIQLHALTSTPEVRFTTRPPYPMHQYESDRLCVGSTAGLGPCGESNPACSVCEPVILLFTAAMLNHMNRFWKWCHIQLPFSKGVNDYQLYRACSD